MKKLLLLPSLAVACSASFAVALHAQQPATTPDTIRISGVIGERGPMPWGPPPPGSAHSPREHLFHVQHQTVSVSFDWTRHAVVGSTSLRLAAIDKPLDHVALDAVGMTIGAVTDGSGHSRSHDYDGRTLLVRLDAPLRVGDSATVAIRYEAVRPPVGVYWIARRHIVWTQGRLQDNRYWVPTYDFPNDKTTWDLYVRSAPEERAFATGTLAGQRPVDGGVEWHWVETTPAPTYFMTVAVGPYAAIADSAEGVALRYWAYPDSLPSARAGFAATPKIIDFLSRKLGTPFPSSSFDQVVVPDFIFWDGLESWRPLIPAVVQDDRLILRRETGWPGEDGDAALARAVAQQWFGKLVTPADWSHLWLSDGIANYLAMTYVEDAGARDSIHRDLEWSHVSNFAADRDARRPLVYNHWQYGPIELLLTEHVAQKSVVVLRLLQSELGDPAFWSGLRRFLAAHANGTVTTADFEQAMEQASGRDLSMFFRQWVYGAGLPFLRVSFHADSAARRVTFDVEQVQKRDSLTGFFDADADVEVLTDAGPVRARMPLHGARSTFTMTVPGSVRAVRWDPDKVLPSEVLQFDRPLPMLVYQLQHDSSASGRADAVRAIGEQLLPMPAGGGIIALRPGTVPPLAHPELIPALVHAASSDPSIAVREAAVEHLGPLRMLDDSITSVLLRLTHDSVPEIRMIAVFSLHGYPDPRVDARFTEMASSDPDSTVRAALNAMRAPLDPFGTYARAKRKLADPSTSDEEKASLLNVVASPEVPGGWNIAKQYLTDPKSSRLMREAAMGALGAAVFMERVRSGPDPKEVVDLLAPFLDVDDPSLRLSAARELGEVKIPASAAALEARKAREDDARVLHEIDHSLAGIPR